MNKNFILTIGLILALATEGINAQDKSVIQLVDSHSKNGIPYAYIKVVGRNILEVSNVDGYFSIPDLKKDSIQISHVAYKTIKTSFEYIKNL